MICFKVLLLLVKNRYCIYINDHSLGTVALWNVRNVELLVKWIRVFGSRKGFGSILQRALFLNVVIHISTQWIPLTTPNKKKWYEVTLNKNFSFIILNR